MANFDNVFTKKYRRWTKEGSKDYNAAKTKVDNSIEKTKTKINELKSDMQENAEQRRLNKTEKERQKQEQLRVKAEPASQTQESLKQKSIVKPKENGIMNINFRKNTEDESLYQPIEIKKRRVNNLYGDYDPSRPSLRDYN